MHKMKPKTREQATNLYFEIEKYFEVVKMKADIRPHRIESELYLGSK